MTRFRLKNVKEAVKKELEGPERSSLRIQLFLLAPRREGHGERSLEVRRKEKRLYSEAKERGMHKKSARNMTFLLGEIKCDV